MGCVMTARVCVHLPIIRGEAGVHVAESVGESSVDGGGRRGDAGCFVAVFACLKKVRGCDAHRKNIRLKETCRSTGI